MMKDFEITNMTGAFQSIEKELRTGDYLTKSLPVAYGITNESDSLMENRVYLVKEAEDVDIPEMKKLPKTTEYKKSLSSVEKGDVEFSYNFKVRNYVYESADSTPSKKKYEHTKMLQLPNMDVEEMLKVFEDMLVFADAAVNTIEVMLMTHKDLNKVNSMNTGLPLYRMLVNTANGISPEQYAALVSVEKSILENLNNSAIDYNLKKTEQLIKDRILKLGINNMKESIKSLRKGLKDQNLGTPVTIVPTANAEAIKVKSTATNVAKLDSVYSDAEKDSLGTARGLL